MHVGAIYDDEGFINDRSNVILAKSVSDFMTKIRDESKRVVIENPPSGFIVTANNIPLAKGDPLYLKGEYISKFRATGIENRIKELALKGKITFKSAITLFDILDDDGSAEMVILIKGMLKSSVKYSDLLEKFNGKMNYKDKASVFVAELENQLNLVFFEANKLTKAQINAINSTFNHDHFFIGRLQQMSADNSICFKDFKMTCHGFVEMVLLRTGSRLKTVFGGEVYC